MAAIGFVDDYRKLVKKRNLGLTTQQEVAASCTVAFVVGRAILYLPMLKNNTRRPSPFRSIKDVVLDSRATGIPFVLSSWSCSNAVNLTDGLDGLAIGSVSLRRVLTVLTYVAGH